MKVSIVTPSFNHGQFIERTLQSVADQAGPEIEHVVFDGGSTDNTVEILKRFTPQVRWVSQSDRGQDRQNRQRRKGVRRARGCDAIAGDEGAGQRRQCARLHDVVAGDEGCLRRPHDDAGVRPDAHRIGAVEDPALRETLHGGGQNDRRRKGDETSVFHQPLMTSVSMIWSLTELGMPLLSVG